MSSVRSPLPRSRRTPPVSDRALVRLGVAGVLVVAVVLAIPHHAGRGERAADLRGLVATLTRDIGSCAAALRDSLAVRTATDRAAAVRVASDGASICSVGNNDGLAELVALQPPGSLASLHLAPAVHDLNAWAYPAAADAQTQIARDLTAPVDLRTLDAYRDDAFQRLTAAARSLGTTVRLPALPG